MAEKKKSYIPVSFYLDDDQKAWVKDEAWKARLSVSEYLRRKVLGENYKNHENAA